jgi:polar amino acid transport system substrate-binding protein
VRFGLILALNLVLLLPLSASATDDVARPPGAEGDVVTVPNFWDPRARLERPSNEEIGAIRFLTTEDFPPFSFRDRRGILIGFNIDLAQAICAVLKVQCAMQTRPFDTLLEGLRDGTGNAIIAGLDAERAKTEGLVATQAYLKIPARFAARKETSFDPSAAAPGGFVGVACGSAHQAYLDRFFPDLRVVCYMDPAVPLAELKAGRIEAVFADALSLAFWLHGADSEECCRFSGGAYVDDRYFGTGLTIVTKVEGRALKFALDYALREIYRAGTYEELYLRYFPVSLF